MSEHPLVCLHESDWGEMKATMKNLFETFSRMESKICDHIHEGERPGGVRDRVSKVEWEVSEMKKRFWWSSIMGGVIGALIGSGSGDLVSMFIRWIMNIK